MTAKFPVLEVFGPTIQGEGMVIGQKTMFVRTAGCDFSCAWCDSAFTWDGSAKEDIEMLTASEVKNKLDEVAHGNYSHVTISGGNPALLKNLDELIDLLHENGIAVALETQGSRYQSWFEKIDELTISPKPPSSKMETNIEVLDGIIEEVEPIGNTSLKVVIFDEKDLEYATNLHERYPNVPLYLQVGNDDVSTTDDQHLLQLLMNKYEWLVEKVMATPQLNNVRVLPQLHTLLWGNKRRV